MSVPETAAQEKPDEKQIQAAKAQVKYIKQTIAAAQGRVSGFQYAYDLLTRRPLKPAPAATTEYVEDQLRAWPRHIERLQAELAAWKALADGDPATHEKLMKQLEPSEADKARQGVVQYATAYRLKLLAEDEQNAARAEKLLTDAAKSLDEQLIAEGQAVGRAYAQVGANEFATDHAALMVRRHVLDDRLSTLARAVYHIRNLQGGYVPNEEFEKQYASLYGGQLKFEGPQQADPAADLEGLVKDLGPRLGVCARKIDGAKNEYLSYYFAAAGVRQALGRRETIPPGQVADVMRVEAAAEHAKELLKGAARGLDEIEAALAGPLAKLGYDVKAEEKRPLKLDENMNPHDVLFGLDGRAGAFLKILECDYTSLPGKPSENTEGLAFAVSTGMLSHTANRMLVNSPPIQEAEKRVKDPQELLAMSAAGQRAQGLYNIWHPEVRRALKELFVSYAQKYKDTPGVFLYEHLTWEPGGNIPPKERESKFFGYATQIGRSPEGIAAFQDWLKGKFGTIEKLDAAWGSAYVGFADIQPPPDPFQKLRVVATPLTYEHERFLRESMADFIAIAAKALMDNDPGKPVRHEMPDMMNNAIETPLANHDLLTRVPARWVEMHKNDFWPALPALVYNATVSPLYGKVPMHTEFIWNWGRYASLAPAGEEEIYSQGLQSVWRNTAYGNRALDAFSHFAWWNYDNGYVDVLTNENWPAGGTVAGFMLRDAVASLPVAFRRARRFGDLLRETRLAPREVVILQPSTSTLNAYPYFSLGWSFSAHVQEAKTFHELLFNRNYQYGFLLEESLFDGKASLEGIPVLIIPYARYFPTGLNEKLLAYVRGGGTVICSGAPGMYDEYGREDGKFLREVFGDLDVRYSGDDFVWDFTIAPKQLKETAAVLESDGGSALLLSAAYGKGRVLISAIPFGQRALARSLVPHFYAAVNAAIGGQKVQALFDRFEIVHKAGPDGAEYLFILNHDFANELEDRVIVKGQYVRAYDVGIGPKFAVPLAGHEMSHTLKMPFDHGVQFLDDHTPAGMTAFWLKLQAGEGTIIRLEK